MVPLDNLLGALQLEPTGTDRYRAANADAGHGVIFGGQLLAQALIAAQLTESEKRVKTIHTVFARGGAHEAPVEITVDRMHSGRALASSTVTISQGDRLCTRSIVLSSADEPDFIRHADPGPGLSPPPEDFMVEHSDAYQMQIVDGVDISDPALVGPPDLDVWVRVPDAPDDPTIHQALLAFISDGFLIGTAMRPHQGVGQAQAHVTVTTSVVSHTLTFHDPFSIRSWLLLSHHSSHAGGGRSYGQAQVFGSDGALVASYVQDALLRAASPRS
jgi:acyl-CoA thioesterase